MRAPPEIAEIERNIGFQRKVWAAERAAWAAMLGLVLLALLGALGGAGPLAEGRAESGGLAVEWPRIARLGLVTPIRVTLPDGEQELRLDATFSEGWRLRDATPPAVAAQAGMPEMRLRLAGGAPRATVVLHAEPVGAPGFRRLRLAAGAAALDLPVLIWP